MKKLFTVLTVICLLCCSVAALAETANVPGNAKLPLLREGLTFESTQEDVIKAHGNERYERDVEHTVVGINFDELEYENTNIQDARADLHYFFINNKLIGVQAKCDDNTAIFGQLKNKITAAYGEGVKPDLSVLGNGLYMLDDKGHLSANTLVWTVGNSILVLEQEERDEAELTCFNLNADFGI